MTTYMMSEVQATRAVDEIFDDGIRANKLATYMKSLATGAITRESFALYAQIMMEHAYEDLEEAAEAEKGSDSSTPLRSA